MLEHLFGSKTRAQLLAFFFSHPDTAYFTREVTRKISGHLTAVRRELENLTKLSILTEEGVGRKKFFKANPQSIIFHELKRVLFKSQIMVELDLLRRLNQIGSVYAVALTGFFVSDDDALTDLLIIGTLNRRKLQRMMTHIQRELDHQVRYTYFRRSEFELRFDIADRFLYTILEGKKIVVYDRAKILK